jgi:hypothetical protein
LARQTTTYVYGDALLIQNSMDGLNKNVMNRLLKSAVLAGLGFALVPTARAQYNNNDLILGFTKSGAQNDYLIDLGNANLGVGVGGTAVKDLSSLFSASTFNTAFGGLAGVNMGVVGGNSGFAGRDLYYTVLRGAVGTPSAPGSTAPGALASSPMGSGVGDVAGFVAGLSLSPGGSTTVAQGASTSWSSLISPGVNPPSFIIDSGRDPMAQASGTIIYEDLYNATPGNNFSYDGYFTLDTTTGGNLTFTPAALAVPEPSTSGLLVCGALLAFANRIKRNWATPTPR